jgi:SAM-dependent methyltransferase
MDKMKYGNWIRVRILLILGLSSLGLAVLGILPFHPAIRIGAELSSIVLFISFLYPAYSYVAFSPWGGNLQEKIFDLILGNLGEDVSGKALDIGTGNGVLAIKLAQNYLQAEVVGLDYWGKKWEYSKSVCETNARIADVSERVHFVQGDAAALDFPSASFDVVVSNLTFHEVKSAQHKRDLVREALRILKPGGRFVFNDYFYNSRLYGDSNEFEIFLWSLGLSKVEFKPLAEMLKYPKLMKHPKILGKVGIVYGVK